MRSQRLNHYAFLPAAISNGGSFIFSTDEVNGLQHLPNGDKMSNETYGVALMELPFFLIGRILTEQGGKADTGFGLNYLLSIHWGGIFYFLLGLILLRRFLQLYFNEKITSLTLLLTAFGTNMFYYGAGCVETDQVYLFFLMAVLLNLIPDFMHQKSIKRSFGLGIVMGLISLIRPSEAWLLLLPFFWGIKNKGEAMDRFKEISRKPVYSVILLIGIILIWTPQLIVWRRMTEDFFFGTGIERNFYWTEPLIMNFLFGFRRGWIIYSPLIVFFLSGLYFMNGDWKWTRNVMIVGLLFLIYWNSCRWDYAEGGGFGARVMAHHLAWLSLPMAVLIRKMMNVSSGWPSIIMVVLFFMGIGLNLGQTYQHVRGYLHPDSQTIESYKYIFGRFSIEGKNYDELVRLYRAPDFEKMKIGEGRDI